jgi:hypothetical protein
MALHIHTIQQAPRKAGQDLVGAEGDAIRENQIMLYIVKVWDEGNLYEYEYGCIEHALEHMKVEKSCAKLYRYCNGVETAVEGVEKTTGFDDSGNSAM